MVGTKGAQQRHRSGHAGINPYVQRAHRNGGQHPGNGPYVNQSVADCRKHAHLHHGAESALLRARAHLGSDYELQAGSDAARIRLPDDDQADAAADPRRVQIRLATALMCLVIYATTCLSSWWRMLKLAIRAQLGYAGLTRSSLIPALLPPAPARGFWDASRARNHVENCSTALRSTNRAEPYTVPARIFSKRAFTSFK